MNNNFEEKLIYNRISFRYAKGKSLVHGNEMHPYHEILYYMDGDAEFLSENCKEELKSGTLLIIPKENYHKFQIKNQKNYTRFVINFPDFPEGKSLISQAMAQIKIIKTPGINTERILRRMCEIINTEKGKESGLFLYGSFLSLLYEICRDKQNISLPAERNGNRLISKCLDFIDQNFTSPISCGIIAKNINVSQSTLFHCFKKEMGISVNKYITQKRMIYAHKLIENGETPTQIYWKCGYMDYSSFYKAYTKNFGHSPSKDKRRR